MDKISKTKQNVFREFLGDHGVSQKKLRKVLELLAEGYCFSAYGPCPLSTGSDFTICKQQTGEEFDRQKCPVIQFVDFVGKIGNGGE